MTKSNPSRQRETMTIQPTIPADETGFVLVVSLVFMVLLGVLGMIAQHAGTMEIQIAANEKFYKMAFYQAEGNAGLAIGLLEKNLACGTTPLFYGEPNENEARIAAALRLNDFIMTQDFWLNEQAAKIYLPLTEKEMAAMPYEPAEQEIPDLIIPGHMEGVPRSTQTLITIAGKTNMAAGNASQMANGYERIGRSAADHGAYLVYDITARHIGNGGSEATIYQQWRHVTGTEGKCAAK